MPYATPAGAGRLARTKRLTRATGATSFCEVDPKRVHPVPLPRGAPRKVKMLARSAAPVRSTASGRAARDDRSQERSRSAAREVAVATLLAVALLLAAVTGTAEAATYRVTNTNDDGPGSLRRAVEAANARGGEDIVAITARGTATLTSGQIDIDSNMVISGPGPNAFVVSGDDASRVFEVSGAAAATMRGLGVTAGSVRASDGGSTEAQGSDGGDGGGAGSTGADASETGSPGALASGAGIRNTGRLVLERVSVRANEVVAGDGGGSTARAGNGGSGGPLPGGDGGGATAEGGQGGAGLGGGIANGGDLLVRSSTVTANTVRGGRGGGALAEGGDGGADFGGSGGQAVAQPSRGGAALAAGIENSGSLLIETSTVAGNRALGGDGSNAIADGGSGGNAGTGPGGPGGTAVTDPGGAGGEATGGGLHVTGTLRLDRATVRDNRTTAGDGGSSTAEGGDAGASSGMSVGGAGGAATASPGGSGGEAAAGAVENAGNVTLRNDTLVGNVAEPGTSGASSSSPGSPSAGSGAVPGAPGGAASAGEGGAGGGAEGGGVRTAADHRTILRSSTITGNGAPDGSNLFNAGRVTPQNTVVADAAGSPSCAGETVSQGFNLEDGSSCGFDAATDRSRVDPRLGPLADNGGPTSTRAPLAGSPVSDGGRSGGLTTDQRGKPRPHDRPTVRNARGGDGSDIGAVEL